jgi:hypothetical protein
MRSLKMGAPKHYDVATSCTGQVDQIMLAHMQSAGERRKRQHAARFVQRAQAVHGKKYDYSKTTYTDARSKLKIICRKHGPFSQVANSHLRGIGCPICGAEQRGRSKTARAAAEFIGNAKKIHGDKYDYSLVKYEKASKKVRLVCKKHGPWLQTPNNHLRGNGCPACAVVTRRNIFLHTKRDFIKRARAAHGNKYSYPGSYTDSNTRIRIRCPIHGEFEQVAATHLSGRGCRKCGTLKIAAFHSSNHAEFLRKARQKHGNRYRYPETYERATKHINVECRKHGIFAVTPNNHLRGNGCPRCQAETAAERNRSSHEDFLRKARAVHGSRFKYPDRYSAAIEPLKIICPDHGPFSQTPNKHLAGQGCPRCMESLGERKVTRLLEKRRIRFKTQHKFPDCIDKRPLRFDFWLPDHNTLIEYDGPQHFGPLPHYGGDKHFTATCRRDKIKTAYARTAGIRLIRIKYDVRDIEAVLVQKLALERS